MRWPWERREEVGEDGAERESADEVATRLLRVTSDLESAAVELRTATAKMRGVASQGTGRTEGIIGT